MEPHEQERSVPREGTTASRRCTMRVIRDRRQGMILVYESEPGTLSAPRALVFESGEWSTRVEHYPLDWRYLADTTLLALTRE